MAQLKNTTINDTGFLQLPAGTTAQRPASPSAGMVRFNTETRSTEWYDGVHGAWFPTGVVPPSATGGAVTNITQGGVGYRVHTFTTVGNSTFTVTRGGQVEFLIVDGGGGGGSRGTIQAGGGGGAGGILQGIIFLTSGTHSVIIGSGGQSGQTSPWDGANGQNSSALGFTAIGGGGGGGQQDRSGLPGGSGGGRSSGGGAGEPGIGTAGQGNNGGSGNNPTGTPRNLSPFNASAGGGAGSPGGSSTFVNVPPNGGTGLPSFISGTLNFYGGGGGAGQRNIGTGTGFGGLGGGGNGGIRGGTVAQAGAPNTGGGGGGGSGTDGASNNGAAGGSGIVVVRYRTS